MKTNEKFSELQNLAEEVGHFIHYWGFKKVHGRIWTHVFLANQPPDAATLMKKLNVSKALISLSLNDLLMYDVIREAGKSMKGTQTYMINSQVLEVIMNILKNRERKILAQIQVAHDGLQSAPSEYIHSQDINAERLVLLGTMINLAQKTLDTILGLGSLDLGDWHSVTSDLLVERTSK